MNYTRKKIVVNSNLDQLSTDLTQHISVIEEIHQLHRHVKPLIVDSFYLWYVSPRLIPKLLLSLGIDYQKKQLKNPNIFFVLAYDSQNNALLELYQIAPLECVIESRGLGSFYYDNELTATLKNCLTIVPIYQNETLPWNCITQLIVLHEKIWDSFTLFVKNCNTNACVNYLKLLTEIRVDAAYSGLAKKLMVDYLQRFHNGAAEVKAHIKANYPIVWSRFDLWDQRMVQEIKNVDDLCNKVKIITKNQGLPIHLSALLRAQHGKLLATGAQRRQSQNHRLLMLIDL